MTSILRTLPIFTLLFIAAPLHAQGVEEHAGHLMQQTSSAAPAFVVPDNERLPPPSTRAAEALERSPRHGEWVSVPYGAGPALKTWVVYPERSDKAPLVLVIHANTGLNDWTRALADQLAEDGFIAVAPDLLSGLGPNGGATDAMAGADEARKAISTLTPEEAGARLEAVRTHALTIPAASGKVASMGFCWGGARSFEFAVGQPALNAAIVFYGTAPQPLSRLSTVKAAVLGLYAGDDARVNATIAPAADEMKKLGRTFEQEIYEGAGHGFVGSQADRDGANYRATEHAWPRALAFLRQHLR